MSKAFWLGSALVGVVLAGTAYACIEALDLNKMVAKTDVAVRGTITGVRTVKYTPPGDERMIYTLVTVEGEDLYNGQPRTLEAGFVGGSFGGDSMIVTSMPAPADYRVGSKVVLFSAPVEGWGPEVSRCVYASYGGVFKEVSTKNGPVILGKGEGFAIDKNTSLVDLRAGIATALELKAKEAK
ncbi:MAG: hypothetical protein EYC70_08260 [Planctomycetota bacterium]|nr:MAG: hypothetical protein EYC70_08260 [Planctomycetota bacterium]